MTGTTPIERAGKVAQLALTQPDNTDTIVQVTRRHIPEAHAATATLLGYAFRHPAGSAARASALQAWAEAFEGAVDGIARGVIEEYNSDVDAPSRVRWLLVSDQTGVQMRNSRLYGRRIILRRIVTGSAPFFHDVTCERAGVSHMELTIRPIEFTTRSASRADGWLESMTNFCAGWRIYA